jgi:dienelactone hydrolase
MTHARMVMIGLILGLLLAGCRPAAAPTATSLPATATTASEPSPAAPASNPTSTLLPATEPPLPTVTEPPPSATEPPPPPTEMAAPSPSPEPTLPVLPPEAQRIEFQAEDGTALVGYYYPAAVNPAPLVVLMHWAGGDQTDWLYVGMVTWLQNRGAEIPAPPREMFFDTPYPFPPLPDDLSFGVFTFDFRGYGESAPSSGSQSTLVMDARAAYTTAAALPGVDQGRVAGIGASIGADGAADGCNQACSAALSLGPGNYLDLSYPDAVKAIDDLGKPAWCVAAQDDAPAVQTCQSAAGEHYQTQIYPSGGHAMRLFRVENNLQPPIESILLDYLKLAFGLPQE